MNQISVLLLFTFLIFQKSAIIRGTITFNGIPVPGWSVKIIGTEIYGLSDVNGDFSLEVDKAQKSYDLEFYYLDGSMGATTKIMNVTWKGDTLDLGEVPVFQNRVIEKKAYKHLDNREKKYYQLLDYQDPDAGYLHKRQIDTAVIKVPCSSEPWTEVDHKYNLEENTVVIEFRDLKRCK